MKGIPKTAEGERVLATVLFDMMHGRVSTPHHLRQATGLGDAVVAALRELADVGAVVVDGRERIVAAYPISATPTNYSIEFDGLRPWANCAFDALAVPSMVGQTGTITSRCGHCGVDVRVVLEAAQVRQAQPPSLIVSYGGLQDCRDRPSLEVSCPFINFFCSIEHAHAWPRPEAWVGQFLSLERAAVLAVDHFRPIIELYRRYLPAAQVLAPSRQVSLHEIDLRDGR